MLLRRYLRLSALFCVTFASVASNAFAQDHSRGRKYKSPPETSHIEVEVVRANNGKPIPNAAVIFNPEKDGKDEGNLEIKTGPDGKAAIDVIPTGSKLRVQVIAGGVCDVCGRLHGRQRDQSNQHQDAAPARTGLGVCG